MISVDIEKIKGRIIINKVKQMGVGMLFLLSWLQVLMPTTLVAGEMSSTAVTTEDNRLADGGYIELGVSAFAVNKIDARQIDHIPVQPSLLFSGVYQYKGLFVEAIHQSQDGVNLGVNIWNSEHWSLDILAANLQSSKQRSEEVEVSMLNEAGRDTYLMSEDSLFIGAGFRATRYWDDNYVFQYQIVSDYFDDQGILSSARLGKSWQVHNWNFHVLGRVEYYSATLSRYLYGISTEEATERFPEYQPGSAFNYGLEVGVAYPLSESLVFRSMYRFKVLSNEITDSPFSLAEQMSFFNVSVSYVF